MEIVRGLSQKADRDIVLLWDDGDVLKYRWGYYDVKGEGGTVYKYGGGKDWTMLTVPDGMSHRWVRVSYPFWCDPLGLSGTRFKLYYAREGRVNSVPFNPGEEGLALSLDQISALQFDGLGVQLSHSLTIGGSEMPKMILAGVAILVVIIAGYFGYSMLKPKQKAAVSENTTPVVDPQAVTPDGHWQDVNGKWVWVEDK